MPLVCNGGKASSGRRSGGSPSKLRVVGSRFAFLRFVAGMRALFALLAGVALLARGGPDALMLTSLAVPYLLFAAGLFLATLSGWSRASSKLWLWIDAAALAMMCHVFATGAPWLGITTVAAGRCDVAACRPASRAGIGIRRCRFNASGKWLDLAGGAAAGLVTGRSHAAARVLTCCSLPQASQPRTQAAAAIGRCVQRALRPAPGAAAPRRRAARAAA